MSQEREDDDICPACGGDGWDIPAGSCGGGCDFCPPARRCNQCRGTGLISQRDREADREAEANAKWAEAMTSVFGDDRIT
jgi:hypothetical protein